MSRYILNVGPPYKLPLLYHKRSSLSPPKTSQSSNRGTPVERLRSVGINAKRMSMIVELKFPLGSELKQALEYIKPKERVVRKRDRLATATSAQRKSTEDIDVENFVQALFILTPSPYRKAVSGSEEETVDARTADKLLQEAKKIMRYGLKKKDNREALKSNLEEFWFSRISELEKVRWDTFEESFLYYLSTYMVCDYGAIRKVNWSNLLQTLCSELSEVAENTYLWPPSQSCPNPPKFESREVSKDSFVAAVNNGTIVRAFKDALQDKPCYITNLKKELSYVFADRTLYKGTWRQGKREGEGILVFVSGETYDGSFTRGMREDYGVFHGNGYSYKGGWKKDVFNGYGILQFPDKSTFEGLWSKGEMVNGKMTWSEHTYQGEWRKNVFEGSGTLVFPSGEIHKGYWKQGQLFGESLIVKPDGTKFMGVFLDGMLEGEGQMTTDEYSYEGTFVHSVPDKFGRMTWKNGDVYEGDIIKGIMHGTGTLEYDGKVYEGDFVEGQRTGKAKIIFPDKTMYEGEVVEGEMTGDGHFTFPSTHEYSTYAGSVQNGEFHGQGLLRYQNGHSYDGEFQEGLFHGHGLLKKGPLTYKGGFYENKFHGPGDWQYGLAFFSGIWDMGVPDGRAECRDLSGESYTGMFAQGQPVGRHKLEQSFLERLNEQLV